MANKNIIFIGILFSLTIISGCSNNSTGGAVIDSRQSQISILVLDSDGALSAEECSARDLNDKVMMLESQYCGHCKATLPVFKEACLEKGIEPIIIDVSDKEQRKQMESYGLDIMYTPTFVFGCKHTIGTRSKQEYLQLLDKFLKGN